MFILKATCYKTARKSTTVTSLIYPVLLEFTSRMHMLILIMCFKVVFHYAANFKYIIKMLPVTKLYYSFASHLLSKKKWNMCLTFCDVFAFILQ